MIKPIPETASNYSGNVVLLKFKQLRRRLGTQMTILLFLLVILPLTFSIVVSGVRLLTKGAGEQVVMTLVPSQANLVYNSTATFSLQVNSGTNLVNFASVDVTFNPNLIQLTQEVQTSTRLQCCSNTANVIFLTPLTVANRTDGSGGRVRISLGLVPGTTPPSGVFELAKFTFRAVTQSPNQITNLAVDLGRVQFVSSSTNPLTFPTTPVVSIMNLNMTASPTPALGVTPTPSPILATPPVIFRSPTPTPKLQSPSPSPRLPSPSPTLQVSPTPFPGNSVTLSPTADTYVSKVHPDANFGTSSSLHVRNGDSDNTSTWITYIKFDLSSLAGRNVSSAKLRLYVTSSSKKSQTFKLVENTGWGEKTLDYNSMSQYPGSTTIGTLGGGSSGNWVEVNLTAGVQNKVGQLFSFAILTSSTDGIHFSSREASSNKPQLVVTF